MRSERNRRRHDSTSQRHKLHVTDVQTKNVQQLESYQDCGHNKSKQLYERGLLFLRGLIRISVACALEGRTMTRHLLDNWRLFLDPEHWN